MFETVSDRMPRTVRSPLSAEALGNIESLARSLDRSGANSRTGLYNASNDDMRHQLFGGRAACRQAA